MGHFVEKEKITVNHVKSVSKSRLQTIYRIDEAHMVEGNLT